MAAADETARIVERVFTDETVPVDPAGLGDDAGLELRTATALALIVRYGGIDGAHHKTWVLDQVTRALAGPGYTALVARAGDGEDGPGTYDWDTGIAP